MKTVEMMLRSHPRGDLQHVASYAETVHALTTCAQTCTACADACLGEPEEVETLRRCISANLDCAEICHAASRILIRQTEPSAEILHALLHACVVACQNCGDACEHHAERLDHCRIGAEVCRHCQERCNFLLGETSSAGTAEMIDPEESPMLAP